ncbi:hypothetical protein [Thermococcus sp.]|uniref:hypothetical protein n=1 Tax=Thermococcus sp. TaxID=35749 RepID=UPI00260856BA|nr:hypothetical protein [Thermococcus sp.]
MLGFLRRKRKETYGPFVYLSEPTLLYNTRTERAILEIVMEKLNSNNILVPSKYGLRDTSGRIKDAEVLVAVALLGKFTSLVGREVKMARELNKRIYTMEVGREGDELVYLWEDRVPEDVEWLDPDETMDFTKSFVNSEFSDVLRRGIFVGSRKRGW